MATVTPALPSLGGIYNHESCYICIKCCLEAMKYQSIFQNSADYIAVKSFGISSGVGGGEGANAPARSSRPALVWRIFQLDRAVGPPSPVRRRQKYDEVGIPVEKNPPKKTPVGECTS